MGCGLGFAKMPARPKRIRVVTEQNDQARCALLAFRSLHGAPAEGCGSPRLAAEEVGRRKRIERVALPLRALQSGRSVHIIGE